MFKMCCGDCGECWYIGNARTCKCPDETKQEPYGWVSQHTTKGVYEWQFNKELSGVYKDTAISILPVYTHPQPKRECDMGVMCIECPDAQPKREPPTTREVKDTLRATGLLTNSQAWDAAEEVMKLLATHGIKEKNT
jgi:hypothetical protein